MPFTSTKAKSLAQSRMRDAHGHFIKGSTIKAAASVSSPLSAKPNAEFEKPLVSVAVNNPFKKILYWLDQIRRHQTTTLAFKLSIPLIALPIVIFLAFKLGQGSVLSDLPFYGSIFAGPKASPTSQTSPTSLTLTKAGTLKIAKGQQTKYLLSLKNGDLLELSVPQTIDLSKYSGKQVLVTGIYNKSTGILTIGEIAEIEVFGTTTIPTQSTSSAN